MGANGETPFERIGGRDKIKEVTKRFYDKVYRDPWLGQYFAKIPQEHIENQQTDFMSGSFKGPRVYCGRMPADAHMHMAISDELFDLRNKLLQEAMDEVGIPKDMQTLWLRIDEAFRKVLVKGSNETQKRFNTDTILDFKKPNSAA